MTQLTADRLRDLLHYDPIAGCFVRRRSTSSAARAGDTAGTLNEDGYVQISVDGRIYYAKRELHEGCTL